MNSMRRSKAVGLALIGLLLVGWFLGNQLGQSVQAQTEEKTKDGKLSEVKELVVLRKVFGFGKVTVYSKDHAPVEGVINGLVDVFGTRFLDVTQPKDKTHLIRTDVIVAIRQE